MTLFSRYFISLYGEGINVINSMADIIWYVLGILFVLRVATCEMTDTQISGELNYYINSKLYVSIHANLSITISYVVYSYYLLIC